MHVDACYLIAHRFPPGVEAVEHAEIDVTHLHALPPFLSGGMVHTHGFKRVFQVTLGNGLNSSRATTAFTVPRRLHPTAPALIRFSFLWVGRRPMGTRDDNPRSDR